MNTQHVLVPEPLEVDPVSLADRLGANYAAGVTADHRKNHGLYLTPEDVARFMGQKLHGGRQVVRLLDPAAGAGILVAAAVEALTALDDRPERIEVTAYEVDAALADELLSTLSALTAWTEARGAHLSFEIRVRDFVLANADAIEGFDGLFAPEPARTYDVVIANPPYFKLNKADPRAQAALSVVHGQPNIYGLFMAISAALLRDGGDFIFITPRSFASGPYFRRFRERFFNLVRPKLVHVFGSRRDAFARDAVLQENVILHAVRDDGWKAGELRLSSSAGVADLDRAHVRVVNLSEVYDASSPERVLRMPASAGDSDLVRLVDAWPGSLTAYGWKISTGPVVPFRAREFQSKDDGDGYIPLLWMNHVTPMAVSWPIACRKPEFFEDVDAGRKLLVPNANYVLMRRFSAKEEKRRLVAAPYLAVDFNFDRVGLENHLNYIHCPGGTLSEEEAIGIAALLNSRLLDTWFRAVNGNTQVSATEIRSMPLPSKDIIVQLGKSARGVTELEKIDAMVEAAIGNG